MTDTCATCRFFGPPRWAPTMDRASIGNGVRRRRAPVALILVAHNVEGVNTVTDFPNVRRSDWCGDFEREPSA